MPDRAERISIYTPFYEISNESAISGRRPIKLALHEIHPDHTHWQENGVSWDEKYVCANMQSVVGMSITAEFLTEDRDTPYGHGMTGIRDEDNMPLFEDATVVGHFSRVYIDSVEINGETKRVLIAEGTLDEMRYPKFVSWLREHMAESVVKGSVEIVGKPEHEGHIIYFDGWKEEGRVPQIYDYSGYAILGIKPADEAAIVMELNHKKQAESEGEEIMTEEMKNAMEAAMASVAAEQNSKWDEYWAKVQEKDAEITQLKADIAQKEAEIAQIRADHEAELAKAALAEAGLAEANEKIAEANAKISELEKEGAIRELNAALAPYTEEQRMTAKSEIEAFKADPASIEINSIVGKICTEIVRAGLEQKNSASEINSGIDIFGMTDSQKPQDDGGGDVSVF